MKNPKKYLKTFKNRKICKKGLCSFVDWVFCFSKLSKKGKGGG
jgi:hypothetical protein